MFDNSTDLCRDIRMRYTSVCVCVCIGGYISLQGFYWCSLVGRSFILAFTVGRYIPCFTSHMLRRYSLNKRCKNTETQKELRTTYTVWVSLLGNYNLLSHPSPDQRRM